jgi:hypothetical protein
MDELLRGHWEDVWVKSFTGIEWGEDGSGWHVGEFSLISFVAETFLFSWNDILRKGRETRRETR